ncbi:MAG: apolipoprotein N-acyltransferase [Bacteroidetes bacterium]|nr:apolipoprotein N-acyltransferase [Bacteroidota bacterium]
MNPKLRRTIFYAVAGICLGLAFPPFGMYTLLIAGYALLIHIIHTSEKFRQVFVRTYSVLFFLSLFSVSWIALSGLRENADRFMILGGLLTVILYAVVMIIPFIIYFYARKGLQRLLPGETGFRKSLSLVYFPFVLTAYEYIFEHMEQSFPWLTAGNAFTDAVHKIQFIEITGVYGLSFWAYTMSALVYLLFRSISENQKPAKEFFRRKSGIILAAVIIVFYFLPDMYTVLTSPRAKYEKNGNEKTITAGIIQPNIDPWRKWGAKQMDLVNEYNEMINEFDTAKIKPDMIILPETAVPFYLLDDYYADKYRVFMDNCERLNIPILIGAPDIVHYNDSVTARIDSRENKSTGQKYDSFNSAILLQPGEPKISHQKYAKIKLVFASERMPYQDKLVFMKNLIRWSVGISSFQVGWDTTVFSIGDKAKFSTAICFESIYPAFFSSFVKKGAQFCVVITNDGWWGKLFGTYQHNSYAILRAVENRRWIVRCANTGVSCVIDPYGNMYDKTPVLEKKVFTEKVGLRDGITFYTSHPDLVPGIISYAAGFLVLISLAGVFKKAERS